MTGMPGPGSASGAVHPDPGLRQGTAGVGNTAHVARWPPQTHDAASFTGNLEGHRAAWLNLSQDRGRFALFIVVDVERDLLRIGDCHKDAIWTTRGRRGRDRGGPGSAAQSCGDDGQNDD